MSSERPLFVVLDGVDGCGKSTQARMLSEKFGGHGRQPALHLREPGSTLVGERIRALFLDSDLHMGAGAEALLVLAARRQMLEERVAPALAAGIDVVCERFHPSTFAYQGVAGGLGASAVLELCERWAGDPRPDLVLLLDLDPGLALTRRGAASDRIEAREAEFHARVAEGYRRYPEEAACTVIDAAGAEAEVHQRILEEVQRARRATA